MSVNDNCSICKKSSDQMLMLSCVHDLCINCAASSFAEQVHIKAQSPDVFICQICGQDTILDASTTGQLSNLAKSFIKMPSSIKVTSHSGSLNQAGKSRGQVSSTSPNTKKKQNINSNNKKTVYFCKQHSQQEISYYCFSCHVNICPQCAIHGKHKDHNVKLIKKALNQVKGDYLQIMNVISVSQTTMSKSKDIFLKYIKQTNQKSMRDRSIISKQFESVRNTLAVKEREILRFVEQLNKKNIYTLTNFLQAINSHYEQVSKVKKSIQFILRKDEVLIFQQYKQMDQLDSKVKQIKRKNQQISGQIVVFNVQYFKQQIKQVNESIYGFKENVQKQQVRSPFSSATQQKLQERSKVSQT